MFTLPHFAARSSSSNTYHLKGELQLNALFVLFLSTYSSSWNDEFLRIFWVIIRIFVTNKRLKGKWENIWFKAAILVFQNNDRRHISVPNQSCGSWTLFLWKTFSFVPIDLHRCWPHVSEKALYGIVRSKNCFAGIDLALGCLSLNWFLFEEHLINQAFKVRLALAKNSRSVVFGVT